MCSWVQHREGGARIWVREGDLQALALARRFLAGTLQGLEAVPSASTARVQRAAWEGGRAYFKEYFPRDGREWIKELVRPSRAHRALRGATACDRTGFTAPRPLCLIETGPRLRPARSLLVTEAFEEAPALRDWIEGRVEELTRDARRKLLREVGTLVGRWHAAGMFHGDLHPGNLLCRKHAGALEFCWLDVERTRRYRRLPARCRVNDLVKLNYERLNLSLTDRMRVWKAYVAAVAESRPVREPTPGRRGLQRTPGASGRRWTTAAGQRTHRALLRRVIAKTQARWRETGWL